MSKWNVVELYSFIGKPIRKKNFNKVYYTCHQIEIENSYAYFIVDMGISIPVTSTSEIEVKPEEKEQTNV